MKQILWVVFMLFGLSSSAWAHGFLTGESADFRERIPQTKTQWQQMAEADVASKNDCWARIDNQFQPSNPPSSDQ